MGRADLEHELVGVAQVDALGEGALGQAPEVEVVAEAPAQQVLGVQAVLEHRRGAHSEVIMVSWSRCHQPS